MKNDLRLIVFFIPPDKIINGGVMSIFSICGVSRRFKDIHKSEVLLSVYPGHKSYKKNDLFDNHEVIHDFDEIVAMGNPESLLLHVPEYATSEIFFELEKYADYLNAIPKLSVNIMNQNVSLMKNPAEVANWYSITPYVTQTTAHIKYTTQELANRYYLPTYHLSTFADSKGYPWTPYVKKENLILLSPDLSEKRSAIVKKIKTAFPGYEVRTIRDLPYEEYKKTMAKAKYTVTFGEGFDGFFIEAFYTGGIGYAVYSEEFFPDKSFLDFGNTYKSFNDMLENIVADMKKHDHQSVYEQIVKKNLAQINKVCNFDDYVERVRKFYLKQHTFLPEAPSAERIIGAVAEDRNTRLSQKDSEIRERDKLLEERDEEISRLGHALGEKDKVILNLYSSLSWKMTKPLREVSAKVQKRRSGK